MKYHYFYQTSKNENKDGFLKAKNRADAYALLRKQGIRPYRLVGDDPVNWQPWAVGVAFFLLVFAFIGFVLWGNEKTPSVLNTAPRQQLVCANGDEELILFKGFQTNWENVLPTHLDRYLAAYAQPGWIALPPEYSEDVKTRFKDDLTVELVINPDDPKLVALLKKILISMRLEMKEYLDKGGNVEGYLKFLESRQDEEVERRNQAIKMLEEAPDDKKSQVRMNQNLLLKDLGITEI